jgi:four helix bundle suffix protein
MGREPLIGKHGGYRKLKTFQLGQLIYDVTVRFCDRYIDKRSRTHDQMVQAARSGVQNIAEGSQASGTSKSISSIKGRFPEVAANAALVLIGVTVSLLDRQIAAQAKAFEVEGGFTERLYRVRQARRRSP